jgi:ABC-type spermidine/putrescine transport system permease subunit I
MVYGWRQLPAMGLDWFPIMDTWQTYVLLSLTFTYLPLMVPTIYSRFWEKHSLVRRHYILLLDSS